MALGWITNLFKVFILFTSRQVSGSAILDNPNYCLEEFDCASRKHLMCDVKQTKSSFCDQIVVDDALWNRREILRKMNDFRHALASGKSPFFPKGVANMRQVSWDSELERIAGAWVSSHMDTLLLGDNLTEPCAKTRKFKNGTGILVYVLGENEDVRNIVAVWAKKTVPIDVVDRFRPDASSVASSYEEYATIAWAETFKIGCFKAACIASGGRVQQVVTCLFGPKGNILGQRVFVEGTACSGCPAETRCKNTSFWPALCARYDDPETMGALEPSGFPTAKFLAFLFSLVGVTIALIACQKMPLKGLSAVFSDEEVDAQSMDCEL